MPNLTPVSSFDDVYAIAEGDAVGPSSTGGVSNTPHQALLNRTEWLKNNIIPAGTRMVFVQASAPTGWTKLTGFEGRGIRLVDGNGGGTGGSSDAFAAHSHTVGAHAHGHTLYVAGHTLSSLEMPAHSHNINIAKIDVVAGDIGIKGAGTSVDYTFPTVSAGSNWAHAHALGGGISNSGAFSSGAFSPKYVDSVVAQKD